MSNTFTEAQLESAINELLGEEGYRHVLGATIDRQPQDVLIKDDLRAFLASQYAADGITAVEIEAVMHQLAGYPAADLYESNKAIMKLVSDGFLLKREDHEQKDLYVQLLDYSNLVAFRQPQAGEVPWIMAEEEAVYQNGHRTGGNVFKLVSQLEITGYEKRIPDGILYINGLPLVVFEFKSAIRGEATIHDAFVQLTLRYKRDIPELFKYNAFCVISDAVNRKYQQKEKGLTIDYIGIKKQMNLALAQYAQADTANFEEIRQSIVVVKDHLDLMRAIFHKFDTAPYFSGAPIEQLHCLNMAAEYVQITDTFEKRFMFLAKRMKAAYDICVGCDEFTESERDHVHFYLAVRSIVFKLTKGNAPDLMQMNAKVQKMIAEALRSDGVEEIFKMGQGDTGEVDLFDPDYLAKIEKIKLPNTRIKLLQQLLAKAIEAFKNVNRLKGVDFSRQFKALVERYNDRTEQDILRSEVLEEFTDEIIDLYHAIQKDKDSFAELGIDFCTCWALMIRKKPWVCG